MNISKIFLQSIEEKKLIKIKFNSFEKGLIERTCVPFDFAPSSKVRDKVDRYQVYDLNSPTGRRHNVPILPSQIVAIELTEEIFDPATYVTWPAPYNWAIQRDWGIYS